MALAPAILTIAVARERVRSLYGLAVEDLRRRVLAQYEINPIEEQKVRIDIEGLETGIYYIRTKVGDNVSVQKIIKL